MNVVTAILDELIGEAVKVAFRHPERCLSPTCFFDEFLFLIHNLTCFIL